MKTHIFAVIAIAALIPLLHGCEKEITESDYCNLPSTYMDMTADKHLSKVIKIRQNDVLNKITMADTQTYFWNGNRLDSCVFSHGSYEYFSNYGSEYWLCDKEVWVFEYSGNKITGIQIDKHEDYFECDDNYNVGRRVRHEHLFSVKRYVYYVGEFLTRVSVNDYNPDSEYDYYLYPVYDSLCNIIDYSMAVYENGRLYIQRDFEPDIKPVWTGRNVTSLLYYDSHGNFGSDYSEYKIEYDSKINIHRCLPRELTIIRVLLRSDRSNTLIRDRLETLSENNPTEVDGRFEYDGDYPISYTAQQFPFKYDEYYEYEEGTGSR